MGYSSASGNGVSSDFGEGEEMLVLDASMRLIGLGW